MKKIIYLLCFHFILITIHAQNKNGSRTRAFDAGWLFLKDSTTGAELQSYDDSKWRIVNLPHDWSIEDLPNQTPDTVVGPFDRKSIGQSATGFTDGGTAWYRKKFISQKSFQHHIVSIDFDGVYMNSEVWLNGQNLGTHEYGYTSFSYDLTPYLKPTGEQNIIAVRVSNEGKNSRWYSGSGIYRHVWITVTDSVHFEKYGLFVTTPVVTKEKAIANVQSTLKNEENSPVSLSLVTNIFNPENKIIQQTKKTIQLNGHSVITNEQQIELSKPFLWSVETPRLYKAIIEIKSGDKTVDHLETAFGIRTIQMDGEKGFLLNGKRIVLKGGCIHHDNGPLGAAAIDRAEERKIELLKKAGYNALRLSHNPPSTELLNACDRLGMLVIDEAFDMWELPKNPQDYHFILMNPGKMTWMKWYIATGIILLLWFGVSAMRFMKRLIPMVTKLARNWQMKCAILIRPEK